MNKTFNQLLIEQVSDFLDIVQELTVRLMPFKLNGTKFQDKTGFEMYNYIRDLAVDCMSQWNENVDFDWNIDSFLRNKFVEDAKCTPIYQDKDVPCNVAVVLYTESYQLKVTIMTGEYPNTTAYDSDLKSAYGDEAKVVKVTECSCTSEISQAMRKYTEVINLVDKV
jgi:hypothetical protein